MRVRRGATIYRAGRRVPLCYWLLVHPDLKAVPRVRDAFRASRAALRG
jgi:hypothetical protein